MTRLRWWGLALGAVVAAGFLGLDPRELWPNTPGLLAEMVYAAVTPALVDEATGTVPLLPVVGEAALMTVAIAAAAFGIALLVAVPLGALASTRFSGGGATWVVVRGLIAAMRSVHELLWAILLLAALGLSTGSAVLALAIPSAGTLARVFGDLLDETPENGSRALRSTGASELQALVFGVVPRAMPNLIAYALYRFECAVRSSAVLGFFGFPTLGYGIASSVDAVHFHETWTYLYALFALVVGLERWSAGVRRRWVRT
ncbi:MAG: ABC transporter permease subunit [Myxococcota bacterium]